MTRCNHQGMNNLGKRGGQGTNHWALQSQRSGRRGGNSKGVKEGAVREVGGKPKVCGILKVKYRMANAADRMDQVRSEN